MTGNFLPFLGRLSKPTAPLQESKSHSKVIVGKLKWIEERGGNKEMSMKFYCIFPHNFTINCSEIRIGAERKKRFDWFLECHEFALLPHPRKFSVPCRYHRSRFSKSSWDSKVTHTCTPHQPPHPGKAIYARKTIFHNGTRGVSALDMCSYV